MNAVEEAILRTVLYADGFHFPLTPREIHHWLIAPAPIPLRTIEDTLQTSSPLNAILETIDSYVVCAGRGSIVARRAEREQASAALWEDARRCAGWLAGVPFVRMVALTGALAVRNAASAHDDLDYVIVTAPNRVWLARAFAVVLVRVGRVMGVTICPNYVLAETALMQEPPTLYLAHEIAQMIPMYGLAMYARMRGANGWTAVVMPNANAPFYPESECPPPGTALRFKRALESLLGGGVGDAIERWERERKLRRFAPEMQTPGSAAQLDGEHVKGHFRDHGHPALQAYADRLRAHGLSLDGEGDRAWPLAGDSSPFHAKTRG